MKRIVTSVIVALGIWGMASIAGFFIQEHYNEKFDERVRLYDNHLFQLGYEHGVKSAVHEEIQWIPAYAVLDVQQEGKTIVLERKGEAVPIMYIDCDKKDATVTISNVTLIGTDDTSKYKNGGYGFQIK